MSSNLTIVQNDRVFRKYMEREMEHGSKLLLPDMEYVIQSGGVSDQIKPPSNSGIYVVPFLSRRNNIGKIVILHSRTDFYDRMIESAPFYYENCSFIVERGAHLSCLMSNSHITIKDCKSYLFDSESLAFAQDREVEHPYIPSAIGSGNKALVFMVSMGMAGNVKGICGSPYCWIKDEQRWDRNITGGPEDGVIQIPMKDMGDLVICTRMDYLAGYVMMATLVKMFCPQIRLDRHWRTPLHQIGTVNILRKFPMVLKFLEGYGDVWYRNLETSQQVQD